MSINLLKNAPPFDSEKYAEKIIHEYVSSISKQELTSYLTNLSNYLRNDDYDNYYYTCRECILKVLDKKHLDDYCEKLYNEMGNIIMRNYVEDTELDKALQKIYPIEEKEKSKKVNLIYYFTITIFLFLIAISIYSMFCKTKNILYVVGSGNWLIGLLILPFALFGAFQIIRGFGELCDSGKINSTVSIIFTILGYLAFFYTITTI